MDLMTPNAKKMANILTYLLNYVMFFKMLKAETMDKTNEQLAELNKLRTERNDLRKEIERSKVNEDNVSEHL
jgi:cell shape-determining protein MreC